jgi:hypothetical protein
MADKKQREYVNPKWLLRQIMKSLPAEQYVRSTVAALWTFSNDYIEKDDIANGTVRFSGSVSYSQLAEVLAICESTAKWRMTQLRDTHQLVEWERTNYGIKFTFGVSLSADGAHPSAESAFRMASTPTQRACERTAGHTWTDYLHTTEKCSACGKIRANLPEWTAADDLEAEYMAWLEEDAPDYFPDPLASYESVDYPPLSAAFLEYLEGSPMPLTAEKRVR